MSKPIKNLITQSYKDKFGDLDGAVLIDIRGVQSNTNNKIRHDLAAKKVKVTVVKNSLAGKAFGDTALDGLAKLLDGPSALVYGADEDVTVVDIAREVVKLAKEIEQLQVKGALMDGQLFGADEMEALSKYPTKPEAQGQVVQIILTPAQKLVGSVLGPGRKVASLIKAIEEKLEKGETIAKAAA